MKGLLFIPEMAVAACAGVKTETRRVIVPQPSSVATKVEHFSGRRWQAKMPDPDIAGLTLLLSEHTCDYQTGERRCLLTTWAVHRDLDRLKPTELPHATVSRPTALWHAGMNVPKPESAGKSRPGRFLPNELRPVMPMFDITAVHAEPVQNITNDGAGREGIPPQPPKSWLGGGWRELAAYQRLWDRINAGRGFGWDVNPWVFVISFRKVT